MLKNKTHLALILFFSHHLVSVWKVPNFVLNSLVSLSQVLSCLRLESLDFASNHVKFFVFILDFKHTLELIDFRNLGENFF